ncbi:hypothetical protein KFL_000250590 [Klebsormidium nitens]|uniref:DNA primase/polymerase bifunctional N-terminal domain-containing protein n=1 Tax=Klebsormidium nitens TaxID=105231 RepID=A0A1Y1HMF0_KLENI|nr:hypothetical protein KFL_000250590 [Klebsormidium nitens]|eukprot:GAQ79183.1 hypothetical protein KFL_000250590 [Klebsormidium nitens]
MSLSPGRFQRHAKRQKVLLNSTSSSNGGTASSEAGQSAEGGGPVLSPLQPSLLTVPQVSLIPDALARQTLLRSEFEARQRKMREEFSNHLQAPSQVALEDHKLPCTQQVQVAISSPVVAQIKSPMSVGLQREEDAWTCPAMSTHPKLVVTGNLPSQPPADICLAAAQRLFDLGVASVTLHINTEMKDGKEKKFPQFSAGWKGCTLDNCLSDFVRPGAPCLAIITGSQSDVLVLDIDMKDNGLKAFEEMVTAHGALPKDTPRERTGNGGLHLFSSLSESSAAGLLNCNNREKISCGGCQVGIDVRGNGGICFISPSKYIGRDGETVRAYRWE